MSTEGNSNLAVTGQKYAFATASLLLGFATFVNLLSLEKAALAVLFGWLALRREPVRLEGPRRRWAALGVALGALSFLLVPLFLFLFRERVAELIGALRKLP
jgi:MFS family permease